MSGGVVWVFSKSGDGPNGTYRWYDDGNEQDELYARIFADEHGLEVESMSVKEYCKRAGLGGSE